MAITDATVAAAKNTGKVIAAPAVLAAIAMYAQDGPLIPEVDTLGAAVGASIVTGLWTLVTAVIVLLLFAYFFSQEL